MTVGKPVTLDARGLRCPWPALRLARAMRSATAVRMVSDDPRAAAEITALAGRHGWTFASEEAGPITTVFVTRAA